MEERVVLRRGERQLQLVPNEVRHYRAAAASLWIEMRDIGNGHVVGEIERLVPIRIAIEGSRAESASAPLSSVAIDAPGALQKFFMIGKKLAVMVEIVYVDLKASLEDAFPKLLRNLVSPLRYNLESATDSE